MSRSPASASLPLVPASFFGMVLGISGLANSWRLAHRLWGAPKEIGESLMLAATIVWALLLILYVAKWWLARPEALREAEDPIQCCFIGLAGVSTSLIALAALPYSEPVARIFFALGACFTASFALWRTGRLWRGGREQTATTPVLYLPSVAGAFVTAIVAGALGLPEWGQLAFGIGVLSWLGIESVILLRLYTAPALPEPLRPTLGILLAPPAVGALAYMSVTRGVPGIMEHALLGYALLMALLLLRLLPWIGRQAFAPSYWAFSFGATALSTACLRLLERGDKSPITLLAIPLFVAANLVIAILILGTLRLAGLRRLFPAFVAIAPLAGAKP